MKSFTVRLPDELHELLRRAAFESRISMNELIVDALTQTFGEHS